MMEVELREKFKRLRELYAENSPRGAKARDIDEAFGLVMDIIEEYVVITTADDLEDEDDDTAAGCRQGR